MYDRVVTVALRLFESSSCRILPVKQISTQVALGTWGGRTQTKYLTLLAVNIVCNCRFEQWKVASRSCKTLLAFLYNSSKV